MLSTKNLSLITLSDDDEIDFEVKSALTKRFAGTSALANILRVKTAAEKHTAEYMVSRQRVQGLQAKKADLQAFVRDMDREIERGGVQYPPKEMERKAAAEEKIAAIIAEVASIRNAPQSTNLPDDTLIEWIRASEGNFVDAAVTVTVPKGKTLQEALSDSRAKQDDLKRNKVAIIKRLVPQEEAVKRWVEDVNANAYAPNIAPIVRYQRQSHEHHMATHRKPELQGHVGWPVREEVFEGGRRGEIDEGTRFLCWLMPDVIIERGKAEIAKLYKDNPGLSVEERNRLLSETDAEILAEERREEAFIRMAEDAGQIIRRRPLANPLAVLGIKPA